MRHLLLIATIFCFFTACKSDKDHKEDNTKHQQVDDHKNHDGHDHNDASHAKVVGKAGDVTIMYAPSLPISDAVLKLEAPKNNATVAGNKVAFDFEVENYELGSQTKDKHADHCANSAKGQHIHLILNNQPYSAHYEADFDKELADGNYVGLAFLSRSYHESIKSKTAYQLFDFKVGEASSTSDFDATKPHMFYSRPKGKYVGKDTKHVLLDFYLVNTELSEDGYKVEAKINGNAIVLDDWAAYIMEGLPMGENTIELTLLDAAGNAVDSPFNPVKRTVTLAAE